MGEEVVRTGVDDLLDILAHSAKVPLTEVATKLKVDANVIQAWVDFLVEEGIVGIEYRFTTPYIYLNKVVDDKKDESKEEDEKVNIQYFKRQFWEKAKSNNIPESQVEMLWKNHIVQAMELQKKYFFFEAQRRKLQKPEDLWKEYKELLSYT